MHWHGKAERTKNEQLQQYQFVTALNAPAFPQYMCMCLAPFFVGDALILSSVEA